jgi:beta-mannanase
MRAYVRSPLIVAALFSTIAGCGSGTDSGLSSDEGGANPGSDAGLAPGSDSGLDAGASTSADSGLEASSTPDTGSSMGGDASSEMDSTTGVDSGVDTGVGADSGVDASTGVDAGAEASSSNPCDVSPVTPDATPQAKNLLCYLYSIKGNHVLSGQQEANWNATPTDIAWYTSNGLKFPAILGSDFLYRDSSTSCTAVTSSTNRAIAYWNAGGITMFRYHMGMPGSGLTCTSDCYMGANCAEPTTPPTAAFFTNVVTSGTAENTSLNAKLDYVAVQISAMKAANVPIVLALFHETQPNGWFWWAETASGPAFIALWKYAFNYLTVTKGLTNIVWLMPFSGSPSAAFYPGKAFVDIGGPDEYTEPANLLTFNASSNYAPATAALGTTMPIALHETGTALQPDTMFPNPTAPFIMWNVWATYENTTISGFTYNTVASMTAAYASQYTITRDEVPNLK